MYSLILLNNDVHPTPHSYHIDSSDPDANSLKIYTCVACLGSSGMSRLQVHVNFIVSLFVSSMFIPLLVISSFLIGMAIWIY